MLKQDRLESAYHTALTALLAERTPEGYWVGELSTSALSTAVACSALALVQSKKTAFGSFDTLIARGMAWLAANQNADGGWGDTVKSFSNISTTMLCRAAFRLSHDTLARSASDGCEPPSLALRASDEALSKSETWLAQRYGRTPEELAEAVRARYGKDRTFSVPILMTSALAGLVKWDEVPPLPFELACFPQSWFRFLRLPVVSYALPALIAIGQAVFHHRPPRNPITRLIRHRSLTKSLRVLQAIQPSNGGFLEAAPLTSFVALGLATSGNAEHPVVKKCVEFLVRSVRPDGSWPIDTNLSTWVTTLAVNALATAGDLTKLEKYVEVRNWLVAQQYKERHPYTGAAPGGWAWTPLPGSVPDADDTSGVLLALANLTAPAEEKDTDGPLVGYNFQTRRRIPTHSGTVCNGIFWLAKLQNSDCGWPTFCRGWSKLPFDRSGADLTAHALRARLVWVRRWHGENAYRNSWNSYSDYTVPPGVAFLKHSQRPDGSWLPLWFGNQHAPNDENPTYGTARVLAAYRDLDRMNTEPARRGMSWLLSVQNADGGWGGAANTPSSIEETALAVEVLLDGGPDAQAAVNKGLAWLVEQVEAGNLHSPTPIGFYFAKLWYFEKLYPIIFTVAALGRARRMLSAATS